MTHRSDITEDENDQNVSNEVLVELLSVTSSIYPFIHFLD
jgi:hypothetical protein